MSIQIYTKLFIYFCFCMFFSRPLYPFQNMVFKKVKSDDIWLCSYFENSGRFVDYSATINHCDLKCSAIPSKIS